MLLVRTEFMRKFISKTCFFYFPLLILCIRGCFCTGELGRLNGVTYGAYNPVEYPQTNYNKIYHNTIGLDTTNVLVIGDSYSHWPCNAWYQYYAEQVSGQNIRTLAHDVNFYNAPALFYGLLKSGKLDSCKIVIVETAERHTVRRLLNFDSNAFSNVSNEIQLITDTSSIESIPNRSDVTIKSLNHIANTSRYLLGLKKSNIISVPLSINTFTHPHFHSTLFFTNEELFFTQYSNEDIKKAKENLIFLHEVALQHGILLIFIVAAGSYDLYQDYIINNPYPQDTTLNYFNDIDTTWFLNTNHLIKPLIAKGEKDMTLVNDTHWSLKSAKITGERLGEMIKSVLYKSQEYEAFQK